MTRTQSAEPSASLRGVIVSVPDTAAARDFYVRLGLPIRFEDSSAYVGLGVSGQTLALVSGTEDLAAGAAAASFRVPDVDGTCRELASAGATVLVEAHDGPHERRAVIADPWGYPFVISAPRGRA